MTPSLGALKGSFECGIVCDILHAEGAEVCGVYGADFYKGTPCLTRNTMGKGQAWYVGSSPERRFLHGLARHLAAGKGIEPVLRAPPGVEATRRRKGADSFLFVLNHNEEPVRIDLGRRRVTDVLERKPVTGTVALPAKGVMVLKE